MYNSEILGWMRIPELEAIENLAKLVPDNGIIVEVGSMFGRSTVCWASSCDPSVTVYAIDIFYENYTVHHDISEEVCVKNGYPLSGVNYNLSEEFSKNTKLLTNVIKIQGNSPSDIEWNSDKKIDLFFLDALHTNPNDWENLEFYRKHLNKNAIICGHDYGENFVDVLENVNKLEKIYNTSASIIKDTSIWMIKT